VDDFLNENGLNEADVEFLDQLQKYESGGDANNNKAAVQQQPANNKSQTSPSPFAPSPSSQSSSSSSSNHSLKSLLDAPMSSNEKTQSNRAAISAQHSIVGQNMYKDKDTLNKSKTFLMLI